MSVEGSPSRSHLECALTGRHICQKPTGEDCIEPGCTEPAGTLWSPLWCPECDQTRLEMIGAELARITGVREMT